MARTKQTARSTKRAVEVDATVTRKTKRSRPKKESKPPVVEKQEAQKEVNKFEEYVYNH